MKPTRNKTAKQIRKTYRKKDYAEAAMSKSQVH